MIGEKIRRLLLLAAAAATLLAVAAPVGAASAQARDPGASFTALMATAVALPATASTTGTSLPATAGHYASTSVIPNSATSCNPNPLLAASECTTVIGHGLKIKSVSGFAVSNLPFTTLHNLHIEIYGPRGKKVKNCGQFSLSPGAQGPVCTWHNPHPNKNVRKGNWCSRVWQKVGKKKYQILSNECIPVHR